MSELKIDFIPVKSSQIKEIGHDSYREVLYVRFKNNKLYSYSPITKEMFVEFNEAQSQGAYFHKNLKMNKDLKIERV